MNMNELTEQEFLENLISENELNKKNKALFLSKYKADINVWLGSQTEENLQNIVFVVGEENLRKDFLGDAQIGFLIFAVVIYKFEQKRNIKSHIFSHCHSLDDLEQMLVSFKHLLWRMEFRTDDSNGIDLLSLIADYYLSPICVAMLVENLAFKKSAMLNFFAVFFYEYQYFSYAEPFLDLIEKQEEEDAGDER